METVTKKAWNLDTDQEYEIELPAPHVVEGVILELDYQPNGLMNKKVAAEVAQGLQLSDEQKNAKDRYQVNMRSADTIWKDKVILPTLRRLKKEGKLVQPGGSMTPYFLTSNVPSPPINLGSNLDPDVVPEKSIAENYQQIRTELATELLQKIKDNTPAFFEKLVIDLLFKMGYGGSREDAQAVGRSGDGGIDGIIKADPLGLNVVYVQAKRWEGNVGAPPVRDFVGALDGEGVQDGIFITTSDFNPAAKEFAERSSKRVILINGSQLARYMIDHNVGVSTVETYEIKRVDSDYFAEDTENS